METKTGKVVEVKRWKDEPYVFEKDGQTISLYTFTIKMDNNDEGRCSGKDKEHKYFIVGATCEYYLEEVQKKDGSGSYINLKRPKKEWNAGGGGGGYKPKDKKAYMSDFLGYFSRYATDVLIAANKPVTEETLKPLIYAYFKVVSPLLDKIHD